MNQAPTPTAPTADAATTLSAAMTDIVAEPGTPLAVVLKQLDDDQAQDVVTIPLEGKSSIADFMVIASGRSSRQVAAMSEKLTEKIKRDLGVISKVEGKSAGDWVLIDAGDVIIHLFRPEVRDFYQLEKMWVSPGEAPSRDA